MGTHPIFESDFDCLTDKMSENDTQSKDMMVRIQKKVLGKMVSKNSIKFVVDEDMAAVLDDFYRWAKIDASKSKAEKLVKDAIKIVVKAGVLFHNKQIPQDELKGWEILRSKINNTANTMVYFHRTPFTYNKDMLHGQLDSAETMLSNAMKNHVTEKTLGRVKNVFEWLKEKENLDSLYSAKHDALREDLAKKLETLLEKDSI